MDIKLFQQKLNDICAIAEENNKQLSQQQIREDVYKRQPGNVRSDTKSKKSQEDIYYERKSCFSVFRWS